MARLLENWGFNQNKFDPINASIHIKTSALASVGNLEVRLARNKSEVRAAQALRYKVFYEEMSAVPDAMNMLQRRDKDPFDKICDHLIVIDKSIPSSKKAIVGTYRFLQDDRALRKGGFISESEFDVRPMMARNCDMKFMELGRACVLPKYRNKRTMELLWAGTLAYLQQNHIDVMFGCASLDGIDARDFALELSFLHHYCKGPKEWQADVCCQTFVDMKPMAKDEIDPKLAMKKLPTLIKGYLRLGAYVGSDAVIDYQFNTIDVLIVMPVKNISQRHIAHFSNMIGQS